MLEECCAILRDDASRGECSESQGMQEAVSVEGTAVGLFLWEACWQAEVSLTFPCGWCAGFCSWSTSRLE